MFTKEMAAAMAWIHNLCYCSLIVCTALAQAAVLSGEIPPGPADDSQLELDRVNSKQNDANLKAPIPSPSDNHRSAEHTCATHSAVDRYLLLVSTMDGKVSGLNIAHDGEVEWTVDTGPSPLLSASISKIEMEKDGRTTFLIPSLDGRLYHLDGEGIEPLPFTADSLLSATFRFNEDSVIVGGKGSETYGLNLNTGKVQYICSAVGCKQFGDPADDEDDILIITKSSKTVRAVEMKSGEEKWNFSVGEHEIAYITKAKHQPHITETSATEDQATIDPCTEYVEDDSAGEEWFDFEWLKNDVDLDDIEMKVVVPSGIVAAVSKSQPSHILWQHKFPASIANAWMLRDGQVSQVSLFDNKHIPALAPDKEDSGTHASEAAALYVGSYQGQLYVQPSVLLLHEVEQAALQAMLHGTPVVMPWVRWTPYLATATSRTPAVTSQRNPLQITWDKSEEKEGEHDVAIYHEQYPYDGGYYVFTDYTPVTLEPEMLNGEGGNSTHKDQDSFLNKYMTTIMFWSWWKEVVAGTVILSVMLHILIVKSLKKLNLSRSLSECGSDTEKIKDSIRNAAQEQLTLENGAVSEIDAQNADDPKAEPFVSYYYSHFEQTACLGKGGFGVVFQARRKMEDHEYAIKRIALHNTDRAKEKVMREVKALARLDHGGIVRYHNSWFEDPPMGWQEEIDRQCTDMSSFTPSPGYTTEYTPSALPATKASPLHSATCLNSLQGFQIHHQLDSNHLKLFGGASSESDDLLQLQMPKVGSTEEFTPHEDTDLGGGDEESWSVSHGSDSQENTHVKQDGDSFDISFRNSDSQYSSSSVPFNQYGYIDSHGKYMDQVNNSLDIVFEDSGCGDHSTPNGKKRDIPDAWSKKQSVFKSSPKVSIVRSKKLSRPSELEFSKRDQEKRQKLIQGNTPGPKIYLYIQMQLCQRESLREWLTNNTLNRGRERLLDIYHQIMSAVTYVHEHGMMHRDLKPSNIFFSLDGMVKIGDFGLVTALEECCDENMDIVHGNSSRHTHQVGTKLYMSPEQVAKKNYTYKVDIYALGVIFFELCYPFNTEMERINTLKGVRDLVFPPRFIRELPDEHQFIRPLLSHDPDHRPNAVDILDTKLMKEADKVHHGRLRASSRSRSRTISSSSSSSSL